MKTAGREDRPAPEPTSAGLTRSFRAPPAGPRHRRRATAGDALEGQQVSRRSLLDPRRTAYRWLNYVRGARAVVTAGISARCLEAPGGGASSLGTVSRTPAIRRPALRAACAGGGVLATTLSSGKMYFAAPEGSQRSFMEAGEDQLLLLPGCGDATDSEDAVWMLVSNSSVPTYRLTYALGMSRGPILRSGQAAVTNRKPREEVGRAAGGASRRRRFRVTFTLPARRLHWPQPVTGPVMCIICGFRPAAFIPGHTAGAGAEFAAAMNERDASSRRSAAGSTPSRARDRHRPRITTFFAGILLRGIGTRQASWTSCSSNWPAFNPSAYARWKAPDTASDEYRPVTTYARVRGLEPPLRRHVSPPCMDLLCPR